MALTAIIVPVPEAEPLLGTYRLRHTDEGAQGMPTHVTLLYPFADTSLLDEDRLRVVAELVAGFDAFDFSLGAAGRFPENNHVLCVRPDPDEPFRALTQALVNAFPEHQPYRGKYANPIPHATVAVADGQTLAGIERLIADALPVAAHASEVWLSEHDETNRFWWTRAHLPLGTPQSGG